MCGLLRPMPFEAGMHFLPESASWNCQSKHFPSRVIVYW